MNRGLSAVMQALLSAGVGDSANVWNGQRSIILIPNQPYNVFSFSLKTDSTFHRGDQVMLSFNTDFIFQDGIRDGVAMLAVTFNNDSVCQRVNHISSSMPTVMQIDDADSIGIKMIRGFFLLTKNDNLNTSMTTLQLMCISNIKAHQAAAQRTSLNQHNPCPARYRSIKRCPTLSE